MSSEHDQLKADIAGLTPMGVRFVARIVESLANPPNVETQESWLTENPQWVEYFGLTISGHHGATVEPLGLIGFEIAFENACKAVGWDVVSLGSATQRFVDTSVTSTDGTIKRISLKSTAARNLSKSTVHISKLTEAAWIQDVRSSRSRRNRTLELFRDYREAVDCIIMLRAFRKDGQSLPHRYQLLEIPADIFASLEDAPLDAFAADGPTIDCAYNGDPKAARVSLDRSDAKITIKQVQLSSCIVHCEWELNTAK